MNIEASVSVGTRDIGEFEFVVKSGFVDDTVYEESEMIDMVSVSAYIELGEIVLN